MTVVIELEERLKGSSGARQPGASLGRTIRTELRVKHNAILIFEDIRGKLWIQNLISSCFCVQA